VADPKTAAQLQAAQAGRDLVASSQVEAQKILDQAKSKKKKKKWGKKS